MDRVEARPPVMRLPKPSDAFYRTAAIFTNHHHGGAESRWQNAALTKANVVW
jgi:hypothetical protein